MHYPISNTSHLCKQDTRFLPAVWVASWGVAQSEKPVVDEWLKQAALATVNHKPDIIQSYYKKHGMA